ncbi:MAG: bifunctional adenosylcobinamide kinase/adenosylcobinamide-phosphate guanylyltransferase [Actinocrinis sp.]
MSVGTPRWRALVLGGARSGKSAFAEQLLADDPEVLYAATAPRYEGDGEWTERIARHRERRPATWETAEVGDAPQQLAALLHTPGRTVLVDSLTLWLTAAMDAVGAWDDDAWNGDGSTGDGSRAEAATGTGLTGTGGRARIALNRLITELVDAYTDPARSVVVVSDEVGLGLVPESAGTRRFRDELGRLNQAFAAASDDVSLVVAGIPMRLKPGAVQ